MGAHHAPGGRSAGWVIALSLLGLLLAVGGSFAVIVLDLGR